MLFFGIDDPAAFKAFLNDLHVTSMRECLEQRATISQRKSAGTETLLPTPGLNAAFTYRGLARLGVVGLDGVAELEAFRDGMAARTEKGKLSDPPARMWRILHPNHHLHGVFIVTGASEAEIADTIAERLAPVPGNGWHILHTEVGRVRPDPVRGHEHFGFADGVSQPGVRGRVETDKLLTPQLGSDENQGVPGQDLLWPGEFVFGYPSQNADAPNFTVQGDVSQPPVPFMENGAYLVVRRLAQLVPEFDLAVKHEAGQTGGASDKASPDLLAAQMVGRWKSGAPIINAPTADDPLLATCTPNVNDFEFGGDRNGLVCPWPAHIRKAYPRDDVRHNTTPSPSEVDAAEAFTQTHRMMRRGIAFGPELTEHEAETGRSDMAHARGLLFKCYVTSLEDQFEFVQQAWVNSADFSQPGSGIDAIIGQSTVEPAPFLGAAPTSKETARKPQLSFSRFVSMQGGEYFFAPSLSAMRGL
jgi:Dyp-type peroxidase family